MSKREPFELPMDFLLGSATASLQIEGGDKNNSWFRWCEEGGRIVDGAHCITAVDHWNRVDEDIKLMKKLNHKVYRMSLEWSRIEPEENNFSIEAIERYRDEIIKLKKAGIEPLVTLHHFSNPLWFEDKGAWTNKSAVELFERYTAFCVQQLGDIVSDWVTINEPNIYLAYGYLFGTWPPGENNLINYLKAAKIMIKAHIKSYKKIRETRHLMGKDDTLAGAALHLRIYDPLHGKRLEKWAGRNVEFFFENIFLNGMYEGRLPLILGGGYPYGKGRYMDYLGINYYSRDMIGFTFNPGMVFAKREIKEGAPLNDLGWEIYPEGIYRICKKYYEKFNIPIFITENGTCDAKDEFRPKYIYDHLYWIKKAVDEGVDIQRYYHWTTMDNFEWLEGESARFGLIAVNYKTMKRTIRKSGKFYAEISKEMGVTEKMIEKYLADS